ncbi:MAG: hypothetical protein JW864_08550 [Spirochaetes bacterium]|nr:hypothetical protein [Spirochaetota bacterium]
MSNKVNNLIIEVSNTLTAYAEGKLAFDDALNDYKQLTEKYNILKDKLRSKDSNGHIEGLCYYNNTENYSLLSGVYKIEEQEIYSPACFGDTAVNPAVMNIIMQHADVFTENKVHETSPGGDSDFTHNLFVYPLASDSTKKIFFASVSSSPFFSKDKFIFIAKLIKNIINLAEFEAGVFENNYFHKISDEIKEFIKNNSDDNFFIRVNLFVFNTINKIFDHMGDNALLEINDYILKTLKIFFKHNSKCYSLSIKDYIAIEKLDRNDSKKDRKIKPEFQYKNINITYQTLKVDIENQEHDYSLWDKILTFENYLNTGDIIK